MTVVDRWVEEFKAFVKDPLKPSVFNVELAIAVLYLLPVIIPLAQEAYKGIKKALKR